MSAAIIVVFREVLEAALIIGIVLAASQGVKGRGLWVSLGVAAGIIGALITAVFADALSMAMEGVGQEIFNATVLFAAVLMLGWHNIWMASHAKELTAHMNKSGAAVASGELPLYSLAIVVGLAVLREGAEIVLFLYGIAAGTGEWSSVLSGLFVGLGLGAVVGLAMFAGLLRIPTRHLFRVTSWMILLLAASLASQAANFLVQANVLPALGYSIWNTSWLLGDDTFLGEVLHVLVGYTSRPSGMQLLVWVLVLVTIGGLMRWVQAKSSPPKTS